MWRTYTYSHDSATGVACSARTVCSKTQNYVKIMRKKNSEQMSEKRESNTTSRHSKNASDRRNRTVRPSIPFVIYQILSIEFYMCECVCACSSLLLLFLFDVFTNGDTSRITFDYNNAWFRFICATSISYQLNSYVLQPHGVKWITAATAAVVESANTTQHHTFQSNHIIFLSPVRCFSFRYQNWFVFPVLSSKFSFLLVIYRSVFS